MTAALFDTHAHYDDEKFANDGTDAINRARSSGVGYIINVSSNLASAVESISMAQEFSFVYAAIGVHPHNAETMNNNIITMLADFATYEKVVAVGEIGLDYHYNFSPAEIQKHWFARQIDLAKNLKLPIIVHNREAHEDVMKIIKSEKAGTVGGVFHCFSGSVEMAKQLLNRNFYISVGGPVTFKNAKKIIDVVKYVPNDRLLIETDCPYLAPEPYRGRRNESSYIKYIVEKIADIKNLDIEEVAVMTTQNAKALFRID